jgi:hypothetical protein
VRLGAVAQDLDQSLCPVAAAQQAADVVYGFGVPRLQRADARRISSRKAARRSRRPRPNRGGFAAATAAAGERALRASTCVCVMVACCSATRRRRGRLSWNSAPPETRAWLPRSRTTPGRRRVLPPACPTGRRPAARAARRRRPVEVVTSRASRRNGHGHWRQWT